MKSWLALLLVGWISVHVLAAQGLHYDMSKSEVEAAAGAPTSSLERSGRAIWIYPDGGRVEFEAGKIVSIQNMLMASEVAAEVVEAPQVPEASQVEAEREPVAAEAVIEPQPAAIDSDGVEPFAASLEAHEAMQESGQLMPNLGLGPPAPTEYWIGLAVRALLSVGVTMLVLKMAFKWSDLHADWGQMFIPALVDTFTGAVIRVGAYVFLQTDQLYRIDDGVSFFALIAALRFCTHAGTLARAVGVALIAKLASIVVWSVLSVVVLNALFG
jgi:hypothetical protein